MIVHHTLAGRLKNGGLVLHVAIVPPACLEVPLATLPIDSGRYLLE